MGKSLIGVIEGLAFPLHEMLGLSKSAALQVEAVSGPTTSLTLHVAVSSDPDVSYFVKTLKAGASPGPHLNLGCVRSGFIS